MKEIKIPNVKKVLPSVPFIIKKDDKYNEISEFMNLFPQYTREEYWINGLFSPEASFLKIYNASFKKNKQRT